MVVPGWKGLRQSARWLRSRLVGKGLILGYHDIGPPEQDPYDMRVCPERLAEQLAVLKAYARPMPLHEMVDRMQRSTLPAGTVAVTFDDGYAGTLAHALPCLERYQVPATLFIPTAYLGERFWWDELAAVLLPAGRLPERLQLSIGDLRFDWSANRNGRGASCREAEALLHALHRRLLPLSPGVRRAVIGALREWRGFPDSGGAPARALRAEELVRMAASEMIDIGAHAVTHPPLGTLPRSVQAREIAESRQVLGRLLGREIRGFSYPHGSYSRGTLALVRNTGFHYACASFNDMIWQRTDPYLLPRFWVPNWDGRTFAAWLQRWLGEGVGFGG